MARDDRRQHGTEIGRHSKIAAFVERVRSKAGPLAVHPAALHGAAQYPEDIAVAGIGAAIAVLAHRAAEFGQHDTRGVPPIRAERFGERCEPVTEGAEPLRQLPSMTALAHMSVPAAEADKGETDLAVVRHKPRKPRRHRRETVWPWRPAIGRVGGRGQSGDQPGARLAALTIPLADRVLAGIQADGTA